MGWVSNYPQKAINYISICKCTITITIRTLNIILRGLDLWTVLRTFMSRIGESPSGLYLMSAFPPPLKAVLYVPLDSPRTGQPIKQTNLADFSQYLTLWKSNCVQQITSVRAEEGVSVSSAWEINVTKSHDVSSALRHYLWSCSIGWWRFLPRCCNTSDKALAPMVLRMSLQSNRTSTYETAADKSCVQKNIKVYVSKSASSSFGRWFW